MNPHTLQNESADASQSWWLTFRDRSLELRYQTHEYLDQRRTIMVAIVIGALLLAAYQLADPWLLPDALITPYRRVRYGVMFPLLGCIFLIAVWVRRAFAWILWMSCITTVFGLVWTWMLWVGGASQLVYLFLGLTQTSIATFFLAGLPVVVSTLIVVFVCSVFITTGLQLPVAVTDIIMCSAACIGLSVVGAAGAYRAEKDSRNLYVAQLRSESDYAARLAAEEDRNRWLSVMAHFFRHELRNAVIGARTSLELAQRCNLEAEADQYLARGRRSVDFMSELLMEAADATTLESALATQQLEPLELSELVLARLEDFRAAHPSRSIDAQVTANLWIRGHAERWVQLMDKLLDNAIEHGRADSPIRVECHNEGAHVALSVEDRGDALPADPEGIFGQFVSGKEGEQNSGNLGLGLFIARVIASRHHGTIHALPLHDPPGARFTVTVPRWVSGEA